MSAIEFTVHFLQALKPTEKPRDVYDTKVTGLGLRISSGGKRTFFFRYRNEQGRIRKIMLGTHITLPLTDARARAREMAVLVQKGTDPQAEKKKERASEIVSDIAELFIAHSKDNNRPNTAYEDERVIRKDVIPAFGSWKLKDIRRRDVIALLERVKSRKTGTRPNSPTAANRLQTLLSRIFEFAVNREIIDVNPIYRLRKLTKERPRSRRFSDSEIQVFLRSLAIEPDRLIAIYLELILTLARRRTEVLAAQWSEIRGDIWTIPAERSKNKRAVPVPLPARAVRLLQELRALPFADPQGYIFPSPSKEGDRYKDPSRAFNLIRKKLNFENFTIHDLRRTAASKMRVLGVGRDDVEAILGHAEGRLIETYHCDFPIERMRQALKVWADYLDKLKNGADVEEAEVIYLRRTA